MSSLTHFTMCYLPGELVGVFFYARQSVSTPRIYRNICIRFGWNLWFCSRKKCTIYAYKMFLKVFLYKFYLNWRLSIYYILSYF